MVWISGSQNGCAGSHVGGPTVRPVARHRWSFRAVGASTAPRQAGAAADVRQRRGSPSVRSAMMLRWISEVPPAMVPANDLQVVDDPNSLAWSRRPDARRVLPGHVHHRQPEHLSATSRARPRRSSLPEKLEHGVLGRPLHPWTPWRSPGSRGRRSASLADVRTRAMASRTVGTVGHAAPRWGAVVVAVSMAAGDPHGRGRVTSLIHSMPRSCANDPPAMAHPWCNSPTRLAAGTLHVAEKTSLKSARSRRRSAPASGRVFDPRCAHV